VRSGPELLEFGKARFLAELRVLTSIYAAAMRPPQQQLPGRQAIMERHAEFPSFRCVVMTLPGDPQNAPAGLRTQSGRNRLTVIGFAYGFHGTNGQWWHDLVRSALTSAGGRDLAQAWLADSFEVAEVHVHPDYQGRGVGRAMVPGLIHSRLERTALLSTQDTDSRARRLYRSLGFNDLLTGYRFPGTDPPYALMGATLPLRPGGWLTRAGDSGPLTPGTSRSPRGPAGQPSAASGIRAGCALLPAARPASPRRW
jgi:GNAT superfamily N-acetyltransferase